MAIYRDEKHAIIRAVAVDSISTCSAAHWQQQSRSGYQEDLTKRHSDTESLPGDERLTQDCMTRALIHRTVSREAFLALVAKYGADENERAEAVRQLAAAVENKAPEKFKLLMIWTWASVAVKRGIIDQIASMGEQSRRTLYTRRREIISWLENLEESAVRDLGPVLKESGLVA